MIALLRSAFLVAAAVSFVMGVLPHPPPIPGDPPDKVLHILAFTVLGGLGALAFPKQTVLRLALWLTAFGALIEAIQAIPMLNRDSELLDLVADSVAALVAAWAARRGPTARDPRAQGPE